MGNGSVKISMAIPDDVPFLLPLIAEYWTFEAISGFDPQRISSQLTRLFSERTLGAGWIATVDGRPVGYLLAVSVFSLEHLGTTAEIDEFFVLPTHRGSGVGADLLNIAEAEFARGGCTNVSLQLSQHNGSARAFYHRFGYRERSRYEILDKKLVDAAMPRGPTGAPG